MVEVLGTAAGVGGATVFGAAVGFLFKNISQKFSDIVLSFAAGIMLSASVFGLIIPSVEYGGKVALRKCKASAKSIIASSVIFFVFSVLFFNRK